MVSGNQVYLSFVFNQMLVCIHILSCLYVCFVCFIFILLFTSTALIVRFLTRRFIGEYASSSGMYDIVFRLHFRPLLIYGVHLVWRSVQKYCMRYKLESFFADVIFCSCLLQNAFTESTCLLMEDSSILNFMTPVLRYVDI